VYGDPPPNTDPSIILCTTVADSVISASDSCEQQPDERDVSSNVSHSNVMYIEVVKVEDDDVSSGFISSQLHNASRGMFRGADVQQIEDTERICNSSTYDLIHSHSTSQKVHTAEKSHECDVCHKTFKYRNKLNIHKRIHTGVKPYVCDVCNVAFHDVANLKSHRYVHSEVRRFTCDICARAYKQLSNLNKHKRTHADVKPHVCDVCNMAFSTACKLDKHRYVHSWIKRFTCDICNKSFKHLANLTMHKHVFHSSDIP